MFPIVTERLTLRRMAPSDLHDFLAYQTHPINLQYQAIEPFSEEKAKRFLERQATLEIGEAGGWVAFAVTLREETRLIGEVGIFLPPQPRTDGDIGWSLHPDYHGHGYATEAARALLTCAFETLELHRVTAHCDTRNTASVRLMERLGMRREAHYRESTFFQNVWWDGYGYALLQKEWRAQAEQNAVIVGEGEG